MFQRAYCASINLKDFIWSMPFAWPSFIYLFCLTF